ncbi:hypothetical protein GQ457_01G036470 [Hibiscus cannabinus]
MEILLIRPFQFNSFCCVSPINATSDASIVDSSIERKVTPMIVEVTNSRKLRSVENKEIVEVYFFLSSTNTLDVHNDNLSTFFLIPRIILIMHIKEEPYEVKISCTVLERKIL